MFIGGLEIFSETEAAKKSLKVTTKLYPVCGGRGAERETPGQDRLFCWIEFVAGEVNNIIRWVEAVAVVASGMEQVRKFIVFSLL